MKKIFITIILFMFFSKSFSTNNYEKLIYDFNIDSIDGTKIDFSTYKDQAILLVNVASYCGFTKQYKDLQKLWETYQSKGLVVIGIPSKSFNQEKNTNEEVKKFCEVNFDINFPLTSIYDVKGENSP